MMLRLGRYSGAACWAWLVACVVGCGAPTAPSPSGVEEPADVAILAGEEPVMDQDEP